jgi:hypothetical protein
MQKALGRPPLFQVRDCSVTSWNEAKTKLLLLDLSNNAYPSQRKIVGLIAHLWATGD